ncbi:acyltransferase [Sphingomonadaceae bacterium jetA1]|jgi:surface polysaccharide O-acyltransferase-like enzyme|uniref:acyltransferase family protein n=1 Tax=Facivitalis istanbulensis TaxID=3075838 RepID=UPI00347436C7
MTAASPIPRHYGLDWLRICAFAILILYHVGMVFVPWGYHVQLARLPWVVVPMLASNPWRLMLLFVVSGYATRALAVRHPTIISFVRGRSLRLLVPLAFGITVLVPPQIWAELASKYGYLGSYWTFWTQDWLAFRLIGGVVPSPAWNHLWFVAYLWTYTMAVAAMLALGARWGAAAQRLFDRVLGGWGGLILPTLWLLLVDIRLFPGGQETHGLIDDKLAHAIYLPALLFGFGMAGSKRVLDQFQRWWIPAGLVALGCYAVAAGLELRWPGLAGAPAPMGTLFAGARAVQGWMAIVALIGLAERHWNRDHPWRRTLTEAVFPFYLIHQTIIVLVAFALRSAGWPLWCDALVLIAATVTGCWLFYAIGQRIAWARPLIGLRPRAVAPRAI